MSTADALRFSALDDTAYLSYAPPAVAETEPWANSASPEHRRPAIALSMDGMYIDQAKQVLSALRYQAHWDGDYILLCHDVAAADCEWFSRRGIHIVHVPHLFCNDHLPAVTFSRYELFKTFVRNWKSIIFLDLDLLIRGELTDLVDLPQLGAVRGFKSTVRDNFVREKNPQIYDLLDREFDLDAPAFNGGVMAFPTHMVDAEMFDRACDLTARFLPISRFANQGLLNLLFHHKWSELSPIYNAYVPTYLDRDGNLLLTDAKVIHFNGKKMKPWDMESKAFPLFYGEWRMNLDRCGNIVQFTTKANQSDHPEVGIEAALE